MVAEIAELVRFDLVLLGFGVVRVRLSGAVAPRAFHDALLAQEVSGLHRIGFVGSAEDEAITKIQCQHFRFVVAQGRNKRGCALRGGDHGRAGLSDHVHAVVVARVASAGVRGG